MGPTTIGRSGDRVIGLSGDRVIGCSKTRNPLLSLDSPYCFFLFLTVIPQRAFFAREESAFACRTMNGPDTSTLRDDSVVSLCIRLLPHAVLLPSVASV